MPSAKRVYRFFEKGRFLRPAATALRVVKRCHAADDTYGGTVVDSRNEPIHPESMSATAHADSLEEAETMLPAGRKLGGRELNDLVRAALPGDPLSVRQFLSAITPLVCTVCRGVMGRQNPDLEDAIQDCLVDVVRALPQFRFECDAKHYVTKVALRRAIAARQRARERSTRLAALDARDLSLMSVDDGTEARADLVRNLLDELNQEQANVLRLRLMLGHSIGEIAGITGVSENTVKTRLRLGKIQLRRRLERRGESPRARR
jgi:RNA polymerase sigma-70 factor, ECF subfamily